MSWKESVKTYGKELEVSFDIYEVIEKKTAVTNPETGATSDVITHETKYKASYTAEDVVSVNPHYDGALFLSVMKVLDLEMVGEHSLKGHLISNLRIGARVGSGEYDYINLGEYIVKECEYDVATKSTKCECYDKMLESMIPYDLEFDYDVPSDPITVGVYLQRICDRLDWTLKTTTFCNSSVQIDDEKFDRSSTYRDVLDQIAQVAGGMIAFKIDGGLYVIYPTESGETIDESNLKSLTIGEKFGPVNSIVLARTPQEDNIYIQDTESVKANGLCEVKLENNQIMDSHRDDFLVELYNQIIGTTYYTYELESYGIGYLSLGDIFTIQTQDGTTYKTIMLNDDLKVTQGMTEKASFSMPDVTETDYSAASKTDKLLNQTMLKVNKQEGKIESLVTKTDNFSGMIDGLGNRVGTVENSVKQTMTAEAVETLISEKVKSGTTEVTTTTGYKFDKDGLNISKSDSPMSTTIDEDGMDVSNAGEKVLVADSTGVDAINLTARRYLSIGTNSRFEDYDNGTDSKRTGCFFIGG